MNRFTGQNVAITGGNGFIGSNLSHALIKYGANVLSISRTGSKSSLQTVDIMADLETTSLDQIFKKAHFSPDYIVHLASVVGGIHYLKQHQTRVLQKNLAILGNSFKNMERYPSLKGQVFMSSVCAYPQEFQMTTSLDSIVLSENLCNLYNPDSTYGWSKIMGEMFIQHYFKEFNTPGVNIRLFNTYGPHENFETVNTHVIPALLMKAYKYPKVPFEVLGDGSQVRSFLYVEDAVNAILKALVMVQDGSTINIGDSTPYTIKEVVNSVIAISGKNISPIFKPNTAVGAKGRLPNITLAKELLDWRPKWSLQDGLFRAYEWIKSQKKVVDNV